MGGSGRARSADLRPLGAAQLARGYGKTMGNRICGGGSSPDAVGKFSSQLSASDDTI